MEGKFFLILNLTIVVDVEKGMIVLTFNAHCLHWCRLKHSLARRTSLLLLRLVPFLAEKFLKFFLSLLDILIPNLVIFWFFVGNLPRNFLLTWNCELRVNYIDYICVRSLFHKEVSVFSLRNTFFSLLYSPLEIPNRRISPKKEFPRHDSLGQSQHTWRSSSSRRRRNGDNRGTSSMGVSEFNQ